MTEVLLYPEPNGFKQKASQIVGALPKIGILARLNQADEYHQHNKDADLRRENDPNNILDHSEEWHQYGIIDHTKNFVNLLDISSPTTKKYLEEWGVLESLKNHFAETVDGDSKQDLLFIAGALHDVMKLTSQSKPDHPEYRDHTNHEQKGEDFLLNDPSIRRWLMTCFEMTDKQIEYIARCVGLHFELGKIRRKAVKDKQFEFNLAYASSDSCKEHCQELIQENTEFSYEIGYLFMIDLLAKTDIHLDNVRTDQELADKAVYVEQEITKRNLPPQLKSAVMQFPVNLQVAQMYLKTLVEAEQNGNELII